MLGDLRDSEYDYKHVFSLSLFPVLNHVAFGELCTESP